MEQNCAEILSHMMCCATCRKYYNIWIAQFLGSHTSKKKAKSSRANGKLGGRPRKK